MGFFGGYFLFAAMILGVVFFLLRRRYLSEKYVFLWVFLGFCVLVLAAFPALLSWLANVFGVQVPVNLLFSLAIFLLLGVALHLSVVLTKLESRTRVLSEEVAILRLELDNLQQGGSFEESD